MSRKNWLVLFLFCVASPFIFVYIQARWALLLVPSLELAHLHSATPTKLFIVLFGCVGAGVIAALLSGLLAMFVRVRPTLLAVAISTFTCLGVLVVFDTSWVGSSFLVTDALAEQTAFFIVSIIVAGVVIRGYHAQKA